MLNSHGSTVPPLVLPHECICSCFSKYVLAFTGSLKLTCIARLPLAGGYLKGPWNLLPTNLTTSILKNRKIILGVNNYVGKAMVSEFIHCMYCNSAHTNGGSLLPCLHTRDTPAQPPIDLNINFSKHISVK